PRRIDRRRVATLAGADSRIGRENPLRVAGSGVLQPAGDFLVASGTAAVLDAGHVPWPQAEAASSAVGLACNQTAKGRLVQAYADARPTVGDDPGVCELPLLHASQDQETPQPEAAVCCLARARCADRNPPALSPTLWHRVELSATAAGANRHLH